MTTAPASTATLLDDVMPEFDVRSRHVRRVAAPAGRVAAAVEDHRLGCGASILFRARGLRVPRGGIRDVLTASGFSVLAERPGVEVVVGTNGRFWAVHDSMEAPADLESFGAFDRPGWAQGALSVRVEPRENGSCELSTETRVRCVDDRARRRFAVYWACIRPFSGWLRRDFLRVIARTAEGGAR